MRLSLSLFGCRLLLATGNDVEGEDAPAVVSNVSGSFDVAPEPQPDTTPEDIGFRSTP